MSISFDCHLFGYTRQVYYRAKNRKQLHQQRTEKVIYLVQEIRLLMPKLGGRKLYHLLAQPLKKLGVGRDKLFSILKAKSS